MKAAENTPRITCLFIVLLHITIVVSVPPAFYCHGDICNRGSNDQFCDDAYKFCRDCGDIKDDCSNTNVPSTCQQYCSDLNVQLTTSSLVKGEKNLNVQLTTSSLLKDEKTAKACNHPPNIQNGNWKLSDSPDEEVTVIYICHEGFTLTGGGVFYCHDNIWRGRHTDGLDELPVCIPQDNDQMCYLYVVISIAIVIICIVISVLVHLRYVGKTRFVKHRYAHRYTQDTTDRKLNGSPVIFIKRESVGVHKLKELDVSSKSKTTDVHKLKDFDVTSYNIFSVHDELDEQKSLMCHDTKVMPEAVPHFPVEVTNNEDASVEESMIPMTSEGFEDK